MCTIGGVPTAARCWPGKKCNKYSSTSVRGGSFLTLTSYRPLHTSRQIAVQRRLPSCSYVCACVLTCVHQKKKNGGGREGKGTSACDKHHTAPLPTLSSRYYHHQHPPHPRTSASRFAVSPPPSKFYQPGLAHHHNHHYILLQTTPHTLPPPPPLPPRR